MGEALSRYPRDSYYVATKFPIWMEMDFSTEKSISDIFEEQLAPLGGEYIDFYLIHGLNEKMLDKMLKRHVLDVIEKKRAAVSYTHLFWEFHLIPNQLGNSSVCKLVLQRNQIVTGRLLIWVKPRFSSVFWSIIPPGRGGAFI